MNLTNDELEELRAAYGDLKRWNLACDKIKRIRNGKYPPDWYQKVIDSPEFKITTTQITIKSGEIRRI